MDAFDADAFCRKHHGTLVAYALAHGVTQEEAQDSVQDVWLALLRANKLKPLLHCNHAPARLKLAVKHSVFKRHRFANTVKRGGKEHALPLDEVEIADYRTPDRELELKWLREAMEREGVFESGFETPLTNAERVAMHRKRKEWRFALAEQACALAH